MKELKEKVKALEEEAAKRTVESVVVVKKSQLVVADDDNEASSSVDDGCIGGRGGEYLPQIEVKVSEKSMLIKAYCEKRKWMLPKLFQEVEKLGLNVISCSVIPFGVLALDITILAQVINHLRHKKFIVLLLKRSKILISLSFIYADGKGVECECEGRY